VGPRFRACHCIALPFAFGTFPAWPDAAMREGADMAQMQALGARCAAGVVGVSPGIAATEAR
jgi:hypothetical protein